MNDRVLAKIGGTAILYVLGRTEHWHVESGLARQHVLVFQAVENIYPQINKSPKVEVKSKAEKDAVIHPET